MEKLRSILRKYWGFESFLPLQAEAMRSVLDERDSIVVLPTGGGKSLCFQAPALVMPGLAVIVSPLISLMKDQVDALTDCGVPAACVNSSHSFGERQNIADEIRAGKIKLLYLSPERLMTERTLAFLKLVPLSFFAIDEAHCISHWGHDFRPEYRTLGQLKDQFPGVAIHAYTATATEQVRNDIVRELKLANAEILIGSFDRPNLVYRVRRRSNRLAQIKQVIERHPNDSGVIYCISRANVDELCATLSELGYQALPYHAGMSDEDRKRNQEAFINDRCRIIVATVAFGMGIDKSDVRYVIHAGAPKSLEHYLQESGRAGRDGLEAECCLFYSPGDFQIWRKLQSELPPEAFEVAMKVLQGIDDFCSSVSCRHRAIVEYFGQYLAGDNCGACDVCLDDLDLVNEPMVIAQKILSCVLRLDQRFGGDYTAHVLAGSQEQRILERGHNKLSTHGILSDNDKKHIRDWIEQLVGQGFLNKTGEYNVLEITAEGRQLLKGDGNVRLLKPAEKPRRKSKVDLKSWEGVDQGLFEDLRKLRRQQADAKGLPPFVVFGDATLRDLARRRPSSSESLLQVHGIGEAKRAEYGAEFLQAIATYCREHNLQLDTAGPAPDNDDATGESPSDSGRELNASHLRAYKLFAQGMTIDEVQKTMGRARTTTVGYLHNYIQQKEVTDPTPWVDQALTNQIRKAVDQLETDRAKPIFDHFNGQIPYEPIRIVLACMKNAGREGDQSTFESSRNAS